jgi:exonuclease III
MKIMSLNCKGLVIPLKKISLKRLIFSNQSDLVLLQETMAFESVVVQLLENILPLWIFVGLDASN